MSEAIDLEYTPIVEPLPALVHRAELDAARADLDLLCGWLEAVLDGMTPQELMQLADVAEEVRQRWGLEDEAVQS